jgi:PAS domain S-box-containing protein/putative nucleotidyltransferase with HDIG domain
MENGTETKKELVESLADVRQQTADVEKALSEAKASLQALRASETRYRRLFETAQDGIFILNAKTGEIDDVNPYMIDMLHYSREEFLGMKLWEVSPFRDKVFNQAAFEELQEKGYIQYKDLPLETKEGKPIAVEFVSNVYKANGDKVIQCNVRNITERKEMNRKLQEAVIFQQWLIDALPMPVFYKDSEGRYLGCNSSFEAFFGQKREQVTGKSVYDLSPKEFADIYHEKDLVLLQNPGIQIYESITKDTDGVVHDVIFHKATFPNMDGSVGGLIGAISDISDLKRAEKELVFNNIILRTQQESSIDGILVADEKGEILSFNQRFVDLWDIPPGVIETKSDECVLRSVMDKLASPEEFISKVKHLYEVRDEISRDEIFLKDGRVFDRYSAPMFDTDGKYYGRVWYFRDITDRKRAEENLKETAEKLRNSLIGTIQAMSSMVEMRDPYTAGHERRVSSLARAIAREMGLPNDTVDNIRMAGIIHDIGKISVPTEILSKPGKLSDMEFSLIKIHSQTGYDILKGVGLPYPVAEMVLQHHERLDGSGYPQGLKNGQILLESQIISVADVIEAIASHRPYRPALGIDVALEEIEKNKGILYYAGVVDICVKLFREKRFDFE